MDRLRPTLFLFVLSIALSGARGVLGAQAEPLSREQIVSLLTGSVTPKRIATLIEQRGIDFEPSEQDIQALKEAKADDGILRAVRSARLALPKEELLKRHLARGKDFENRGAPAEAEREYRAALQLASGDAALHASLGNVLTQQEKWAGAIASYRQALRLKPDDYETGYRLGVAFREKGNQGAAIKTWNELLKHRKDDPRVYEQLGRIFVERRDWRRAAVAYRSFARLRPEASAFMSLGVVLRNAGDSEGALTAFRRAVQLKPDDAVAHNNLGFALEEKGDLKAALEQYRLAVEQNPQDSAIRSNFERVEQKLRKPSLVKK